MVFADTGEALANVVRYLGERVVIDDAEAVLAAWDGVIDQANAFASALNARDLERAEDSLSAAREAFERTPARLESLAEAQERAELRNIYEFVESSPFVEEDQWLATAQTLLELARELEDDGDEDAYQNAVAEWNGLVDRHEEISTEVQEAIDRLIGEFPAVKH